MMKPMIMGGLMGLMMMWMLHGALSGDATMGAGALVAFIGVHVLLALLLGGAIWMGTRLSPRLQSVVQRLHRPRMSHVSIMLCAAMVVGGLVHLTAHGFGGMS